MLGGEGGEVVPRDKRARRPCLERGRSAVSARTHVCSAASVQARSSARAILVVVIKASTNRGRLCFVSWSIPGRLQRPARAEAGCQGHYRPQTPAEGRSDFGLAQARVGLQAQADCWGTPGLARRAAASVLVVSGRCLSSSA